MVVALVVEVQASTLLAELVRKVFRQVMAKL
jgi:hypothetical protein